MTLNNLLNQKFGKLLVIEKTTERKKRHVVWKCLCDCGNICYIKSTNLAKGYTRSCGCLRKKGFHNKVNRLESGESSFNALYRNYKSRSKRKNILFNLTKEEFKSLTQQNCDYCGANPNQIILIPQYNGHYKYNGVDRIDNNKGYTLDNTVPCCGKCNKMKGTLSRNDFLFQIKKIYKEWGHVIIPK